MITQSYFCCSNPNTIQILIKEPHCFQNPNKILTFLSLILRFQTHSTKVVLCFMHFINLYFTINCSNNSKNMTIMSGLFSDFVFFLLCMLHIFIRVFAHTGSHTSRDVVQSITNKQERTCKY